MTWRTLRTIAHSCMVHAGVLEACVNISLLYTADHILLLLPIKGLINKEGNPTKPFKITTGTKPLLSNLRVLFCPYIVRKSTVYVGTKELNTRHQLQKWLCVIFIRISQHQKVYLVYSPHKRKIVSS